MIRLTPPTRKRFAASGWGAPRAYRGGWHAGIDFPDSRNAPVLAAAPGKVVRVKNVTTSVAGKYTVIDHGGGVFTRYLHVDKNLKKPGDFVKRGEVIAEVGTSGTKSSGPHVHFDVKLTPATLREYEQRYGKPSTGFSKPMAPWGVGVPTETFMDEVTYRPGVIESSLNKGVVMFKKPSTILVALGGAGLLYWLHRRFVSKP